MHCTIALMLSLLLLPARVPPQQGSAAGFVTVLGRDTVALESFRRSASRLDGDILLRAPRTVRYHYAIEFRPDGGVSRSVVDFTLPGADMLPRNRTAITFSGDSVRVDVDTAGVQQTFRRAVPRGTAPELMSGFDSDYGLYISLGMYESILARLRSPVNDTAKIPVIGAVGGQPGTKLIVRRSDTLVDVDYFKILWTHLAVNASGQIDGADATETTEKTRSIRTAPINIDSAAREYVRRDRGGKAFGVASPPDSARAQLGSASIRISYSSPRKRGREILGTTVRYDRVWRTGANAATVLTVDRPVRIGGFSLPAGAYSLWTVPSRDGAALIINRETGQWGTNYDSAKDVAKLPMHVSRGRPVQENFRISVSASGNTGELQLEWDDFVWSIPISAP